MGVPTIDQELAELAETVIAQVGRPLDAWAVAAALESNGLRDVDAVRRYGRSDIFDLASAVYPLARGAAGPVDSESASSAGPEEPRTGSTRRAFLRGAFFFVPLALQAASLLIVGYSQWASLHFSLEQASIIATAVGASFVVTGGSAQALGRLGPFFDEPGKHLLTERATYRMLGLGMLIALVAGMALWLPLSVAGAFPAGLVRTGAVFYALLSMLWLVTGVLYMLRAYAVIVLATIAGLAVAVALRGGFGTGLHTAQWSGLGTSVLVALAWAARRLRQRARATAGEQRLAQLPPMATLRRLVAPYYTYGTLYFGFIFIDRLVAWTTGQHPLPVWFRIEYELGLDGALVAVVAGMAFLEVLVKALPDHLESLQRLTPATRRRDHNRAQLGFHARRTAVVAVLLALGTAVAYGVVLTLSHVAGLHGLHAWLTNPVSRAVFLAGVGGYALLCLGLANAAFLFSLARPWLVVRALVFAVVVDLAVGSVLSRTGPYWHSVFGLVAGAAAFVLASAWAVRSVGREADFAYYASF